MAKRLRGVSDTVSAGARCDCDHTFLSGFNRALLGVEGAGCTDEGPRPDTLGQHLRRAVVRAALLAVDLAQWASFNDQNTLKYTERTFKYKCIVTYRVPTLAQPRLYTQ